jgi:hypothetical protein
MTRIFLLLLASLSCTGPAQQPSIKGIITSREGDRILVEETPGDSAGSNQASVRLTPATRVQQADGSPAQPNLLEPGRRVSVWFEGPVLQSYPVQATAGTVRIHSLAPEDSGGRARGAENEMEITGVVWYSPLEGGFYAIRGDDGGSYVPSSLPEEFRHDGLPVVARVRLRKDMASVHQTGQIVELLEIRRR